MKIELTSSESLAYGLAQDLAQRLRDEAAREVEAARARAKRAQVLEERANDLFRRLWATVGEAHEVEVPDTATVVQAGEQVALEWAEEGDA